MSSDLKTGERLMADQSLELAEFRAQLAELGRQLELLRAEQSRARNGDAIYGATEPNVRRTGSQETAQLQAEIRMLRAELETMRAYAARLESFAQRNR